MIEYGTTKRGRVKFEIGSKQDRYLHFKDIDHSHVKIVNNTKRITRYGKNYH